MQHDIRAALSAAMGTMVRTEDGRSVRHAVQRLDVALGAAGWSPAFRAAYINACQHVADTLAGDRTAQAGPCVQGPPGMSGPGLLAAAPPVSVTEHWCLGLDKPEPGAGLCLHCETCAHVWRGQAGALLHPPGRIVLTRGRLGAVPQVVVCGLRRAVEHAESVATLARQVRDTPATRVSGCDRSGFALGGPAG